MRQSHLPGPLIVIRLCTALGLVVLQTISALADRAAADTCAAGLSADQQRIYQAVKPDVKPQSDLFALVRTKVIALVKAGQVPRQSAPQDAQITARCLSLIQS